MIKKLYSIRDAKAEIFHPPMSKLTHSEALRDFKNIIKTGNNPLSLNPEDYDMYYIGEFDDCSGKMNLLPSPQHLEKAINLVDNQPALNS